MVRYLILGLLRDGVARHGYALMKEYREGSGFPMSVGNLYRELQRLVTDGLVCPATNPPGVDPRRTPYQITEAGTVAADAWLAKPTELMTADRQDELSLRAFLIARGQGRADHATEVLDRWHEELSIRRRSCEREHRAALAHCADIPTGFAALGLLLARRLKHVSADLEFVEEYRAAYQAWAHSVRAQPAMRSRGVARSPHGRTRAGAM